MQLEPFSTDIFLKLRRVADDSHKGENGRLLVVGGSELFHAAIFWSADVASRIVDLVHFASATYENETAVRSRLKQGFWNGIVVSWKDVQRYVEEDDCMLVGPGMVRPEGLADGELSTKEILKQLLDWGGEKRMVIDGGALQEIPLDWLHKRMILTPHRGEWQRLIQGKTEYEIHDWDDVEERAGILIRFVQDYPGLVVVAKGREDVVVQAGNAVVIEGGSPGMSKGGTGDVLAGVIAGLYCTNDALVAACIGSYVNKKAGEYLEQRQGIYFNASDLVLAVPKILNRCIV